MRIGKECCFASWRLPRWVSRYNGESEGHHKGRLHLGGYGRGRTHTENLHRYRVIHIQRIGNELTVLLGEERSDFSGLLLLLLLFLCLIKMLF